MSTRSDQANSDPSVHVVAQEFSVTRDAREALAHHRGKVVWFTGLSGAGKSTIADATERALHARGLRTYVLDGDNVRHGLCKDLGFSADDRAENVRRVAEVAHLMVDAGIVVLVCLISPFASDRRKARALFDEGEFVEVFVDTPLDVCIERDPKGLYAKSAAGQLRNMTGVGQDYEPPAHAEVIVQGGEPVVDSAKAVLAALELAP